MIENVEGLQNINNGDTLKFIINELEKENEELKKKIEDLREELLKAKMHK